MVGAGFAVEVVCCAVLIAVSGADAAGVLRRIAGRGTDGFSGDGGPAREAEFGRWLDIAVDESGTLFIADTFNHRLRRVDPATGLVDTVAGTGERGFGGDGGPAARATLGRVRGVAVDRSGTLYVADAENHRVRRINREGVITTVTGGGGMRVPSMQSRGGGPALRADLQEPITLTCDGRGMIYIGTWFPARVWRVDPRALVLWLVAGDGRPVSAGDGGPAVSASIGGWTAIGADGDGTVFLAERDHHRVRAINPTNGVIDTVAGTGIAGFSGDGDSAVRARLNGPSGVAADAAGNLYIADRENHRIRRVERTTGTITTIAGNGRGDCTGRAGPALETAICPEHIALDGRGSLYFTDGRPVPVVMLLEVAP
jgi:sugar lactone lactonase YvrE